MLGLVGLSDRAAACPGQLSGAGLATALVNAPSLAGEPIGDLDGATETWVLALLSGAAARGTVLVASHSPAVVAAATRIVRLIDGRIRS